MKKCFVVCPIGSDDSDTRKRSDKLLKFIIQPLCSKLDFEVIRVDNVNETDTINDTIFEYLRTADLVIADLTDHNPNAFYEIGYRNALQKPYVQLIEEGQSLPFDVANIRTFNYAFDVEKTTQLIDRLEKTINSFNYEDTNFYCDEDTNQFAGGLNIGSEVLNMLYTIQDSLDDLKKEVRIKDRDTISTLANQLTQQATRQAPETALANMMTSLMSTPNGFENLVKLAEFGNSLPSKVLKNNE